MLTITAGKTGAKSNTVYIQNSVVFNVFETGNLYLLYWIFLQMTFTKDIQ